MLNNGPLSDFWIGGRTNKEKVPIEWVDGRPFDFSRLVDHAFKRVTPSDKLLVAELQNCLVAVKLLNKNVLEWAFSGCDFKRKFICAKPANKFTYSLVNEDKIWAEA